MPLHAHTVMVPYRLDDEISAPLFSLEIETAASSPDAALATAQVVAETSVAITHGRAGRIHIDRARVAPQGNRIMGPYAYVFTAGDRIPMLTVAARIDANAGEDLNHALNGLAAPWTRGVILDCAALQAIASPALQTLAKHAARLRLQLFRVPDGISASFKQLGLDRSLAIHPDLRGALQGLRHTLRREAQEAKS
ncbi:MAG: hypothetical protein PF961_09990 [Planctomycetota bacterium]|jgi:anti-anti-sigma regulatory factor|nr:hypothetical protein [Planctomycetota bacterium]